MKCAIASRRCAALTLAGSYMLVSPAFAAAPKLHFTDLGTFGGRDSRAYGINNRGQVVGYSQSHVTTVFRDYDWINQKWIETPGSYDPENAFVYDHGKVYDLGRTNESSRAWGINDAGQIVGSVGDASNTRRAFRTLQGPLKETDELGFLDGSIQSSQATAINDAGLIVGDTYDAQGGASFIYRNDKMINAGSILGSPGNATAVNNNGKIVGQSYLQPGHIGPLHAFMQDAATLATIDVGTIATKPYSTNWQGVQYANQSEAWDINDLNQVVGQSYIDVTGGPSIEHAFLWNQGVMKDLGTLSGGNESEAFAINNKGDIVGRSNGKAFLYTSGQMYDLNKVLDATLSGWKISEAWDINDYGQIVGFATNGSDEHGFVLSPLTGVPSFDPDPSIPLLKGTFSASYLSRPAGVVNLAGDANMDGVVNALDFNVFATHFGMTSGATVSQGDFNGDTKVNTADFNVLALHFNESSSPSPALGAAVPEPTFLGFASAAVALLTRKRR